VIFLDGMENENRAKSFNFEKYSPQLEKAQVAYLNQK